MQKFFSLFRKKTPRNPQLNTQSVPEGWNTPLKAKKLLDTPLRQQYLSTIWQNVSMTPAMFDELYRKPIEKYAEMVQLLPASESHHHAHLGGMLDHGLEVISIATKLRQNYVLPQNVAPEDQAKQRDAWTAVVIYAALVHDIGKVACDIEVLLQDGSRWLPWQGMPAKPYNFRYVKNRDYQLHPVLGGFFANMLIPQAALDWIAVFPQAFSSLMYFCANHTDKSGILAEIIQKADQISVTMALGGDPDKISEKPKESFAKQLQMALCHVVTQQFKLSSPVGGSDGWLVESGLWLMSRTTADSIRAYLLLQGISVPSHNSRIFDELLTHNLIEKNGEGVAIWHAKIQSANFKPEKPFTLLKVNPNVIWSNVEQRPTCFDGQVIPTDEKGNVQNVPNIAPVENTTMPSSFSLDIAEPINNLPIQSLPETANNIAYPEAEHTVPKAEPVFNDSSSEMSDDVDSSLDFALSLFPVQSKDTDVEPQYTKDNNIQIEPIPIQNLELPPVPKDEPTKQEKSRQEQPISLVTGQVLNAQSFVQWVKASFIAGKLAINSPNAKLHIVENHLFLVTPGIFQLYCRDVVGTTDDESWTLLQKQFQNLGLHKRLHMRENGSQNIWDCRIIGPVKSSTLRGYLIENVKPFIGDKLLINNQWLTLQGKVK